MPSMHGIPTKKGLQLFMVRGKIPESPAKYPKALHFGAFLKVLRHRHGIRQLDVLTHLSGWTQTNYSRLETDELAPAFDQLVPLYLALRQAGVDLTPHDRQQFLMLARVRIETKRSHLEHKTDQQWDELRLQLSRIDHGVLKAASTQERPVDTLRLLETRHLVGREDWLASVITSLQGTFPKKLIVLQGSTGLGKSSELHRIALHVLSSGSPQPYVMLCELPPVEQESEPENAFDLFLGTLLAEIGPSDTALHLAPLEVRMKFVLTYLEKGSRPFLLLVDNAEQVLDEKGKLAGCWEHFLRLFLRRRHAASLVLATKEWPGWFEGERLFLSERLVPSLSIDEGVTLLQRLGLATVPTEYLQRASEAVGGVPLCLEWLASLAQEPVWLDSWDTFDDLGEQGTDEPENLPTRRLRHLLDDPMLFGGPIADRLTPLLAQVIEKRLSPEAASVLNILALANIPLGKESLQIICSRPQLLKELHAVSLLANHSQRVQVLPMVAAGVRTRLSVEQQRSSEEKLIEAYRCWLKKGKISERETGAIVTELAILYLTHHRLLDAAQFLIRYGWMSFNQGYASRLAYHAANVMSDFDWHQTKDNECGGLLLNNMLPQFLGNPVDNRRCAEDYQRIHDAVLSGEIVLRPPTEVTVEYGLMVHAMNELHFEEAQAILEAYCRRLEPHSVSNLDLRVSLLEKRAWLFGTWCEHNAEQRNRLAARTLREQAILLYEQCITILSESQDQVVPRRSHFLKKRLARALNNLGYHLNRKGQYKEALHILEQSIDLKERGYSEVDTLADAYGEKAEALAGLGRYQEALMFDEKALTEIQRLANTGHTPSQEEIWVYRVNRGKLYLRLGRIEEAEQLLKEALPHICPRRRMYRMFAKDALEEIEQWRRQATLPQHQLDWRWVERYRKLVSYDGHWWLTWAGPFTEEEQGQWEQLCTQKVDEVSKERMGSILAQSRQRELVAAITEGREPNLRYPALDIKEVRHRIAALLQLDTEIGQEEPNALVRKLYHQAIVEEELYFLRIIEATYEGNTQHFWKFNRLLNPMPTSEEMQYALSHIRQAIIQGFRRPETADVSKQLQQFLLERLQIPVDISSNEEAEERQHSLSEYSSRPQQTVSALTAKRFFEAVLHESGYDNWQVVIDANTSNPRVEQGLRRLFLPETKLSLDQIRHYFSHEIAGHVARCIAGEHSQLGLLGIHTRNSLPIEEGLAYYQERQVATLHGQPFDDSGIWLGTLATGLASGVVTPPQTFLSLFTFFEAFFLLRRLLKRPNQEVTVARKHSQKIALDRCLRTYRGVPDLRQAGVCYLKDAVYLHGLWMVEQAVAQDAGVLDRLGVGVVSLEQLSDLQELGIVGSLQPLRKRAFDPHLDAYILSFETSEEHA